MRPSFSSLGKALVCTYFFSTGMLAFANGPTKVTLDRGSFSPQYYDLFQSLADQVVGEVNILIPGNPQASWNSGIVCFESSALFDNSGVRSPVTLTGPKLPGEPSGTTENTIRIAVHGVQPLFMRRFALQLAHELAHVKMGPTVDNALIETLATAISYEVLNRLGFYDYLIPTIQTDIRLLPDEVQSQLASGDLESLRRYWQSRMSVEWNRMDDRPMQTLGALLLKMGNDSRWESLVGISALSNSDRPSSSPTSLCPPDIPKMNQTGFSFNPLGY